MDSGTDPENLRYRGLAGDIRVVAEELVPESDPDARCPLCGSEYRNHFLDPTTLNRIGKPFLKVLCNRRLVKVPTKGMEKNRLERFRYVAGEIEKLLNEETN